MKILVTVEPGLSHANAIIPFADVLRRAGHNLLVAAGPTVVSNFKRAGFVGRSVAPDPPNSEDPVLIEEIPGLRTARPQKRIEISRREVSVRRRAVPLAQAILPLVNEWTPDLILRDSTELAGWAVAERCNIPHMSIEVGLHWTPKDWYGLDGSALATLRASIGLPKDYGPPTTLYRYLHIGTSPPGFLPPTIRLPDSTQLVRPTFHDNYGEALTYPLTDEWAYLTFGTVYKPDEDVVCALAADLANSFQHVLVSGSFAPPAANVTVASYIPQSLIMSRCAVVVCHGGRNTVLTALSAGVPVVCAPIASDQFFISERVNKLGVGKACSWDVSELGTAAIQVARQRRYRKNAIHFSEIIGAMPSVETTVSTIEGTFKPSERMS
jgi:UDP:flavonoid glycosyltransferase YjiC (YdhE family)